MARVIEALEEHAANFDKRTARTPFSVPPSLSVGRIEGGQGQRRA